MSKKSKLKKRILFVDDELLILHGLRGLLRKKRSQWVMVFVNSAADALKQFELEAFDVIVTDMQMPQKSGVALLTEIKNKYPKTIRIILSGQSKQVQAMKALHLSHQYLSKPCNPSNLISIIDNASRVTEVINDEEIKKRIGKIANLPVIPKTYFALTKAFETSKTTVSDIVKIIESDIAIAAKILQIVNSSFFGIAKRITSIQRAIVHLGTNMLKSIVLAEELNKQYESCTWPDGFSLNELQQHSYATAQFAMSLGKNIDISKEDLFIAGLLHDTGKLILASSFPDMYTTVIQKSQSSNIPIHCAEYEIYSLSHAEVGGYLLGIWGLPLSIVEAVSFHHKPSSVEHDDISVLDIIHIADFLVKSTDSNNSYAFSKEESLDIEYIKEHGLEGILDLKIN